MRLEREGLLYEETAKSRRQPRDEDFHPLDVTFVFSAMLECDHCNEKVSCCGDGENEPEYYRGEEEEQLIEYIPLFFVRYFSNPMRIFVPPRKCPERVKNSVFKSFLVFFCNIGAAANHVRQCAEEILTHSEVDSKNKEGGFLPLEKRIQLFEAIDHENAERVNALRWIGNFGSHPESLTKDDVFNAYDILEVLLEDLYIGHQRSVRALVERINKAKGPGP